VWSSGAVAGAALGVLMVAGFVHLLEHTPAPREVAGPHTD